MSRLRAGWVVIAAVLAAAAIAVPVAVGQNGNGNGDDGEAEVPDVTRSFEVPEDVQKFEQCMSEHGVEAPPPPLEPGSEPQTEELPAPPEGIEEAMEACAELAPGPMIAPGGPPHGAMPALPCPEGQRGSDGDSNDASTAASSENQSA